MAAPQFKPEPELDALMGQAAGPPPTARSAAMPQTRTLGASYQMPQAPLPDLATVENMTDAAIPPAPPAAAASPSGKRWQYRLPGQEPMVLDQGKAREDLRGQREAEAEGIRQQLQNPNLDPGTRNQLERYLANTLAGIPPKMQVAMMTETGRGERQDRQLDTSVELEKMRQEGATARAQIKGNGKKGGGTLGGYRASGATSGEPGEFIDMPRGKYGTRGDMLEQRVSRDWNSYVNEQDLKVQLKGLRRLQMAEHNLNVGGKSASVVNAEATFNYLGFLRGGVPVKNETDEMIAHRQTWNERMHAIAVNAGYGEAYDRLVQAWRGNPDWEPTKEEKDAFYNQMPASMKDKIRTGIVESLDTMTGQVKRSVEPFAMRFATMRGPGATIFRQQAINRINSVFSSAGVNTEFNPFKDTILPGESKFMREPTSAAPAGKPATASSALERALGGE